MDISMDVSLEHNMNVLGHNFLDTIDLDIMEQTIIDDVMAEISTTDHFSMSEPIIPRNCSDIVMTSSSFTSEAIVPDSTIAQSKSEPVMKDVIKATDVEALLEQFEEASSDLTSPVKDNKVENVSVQPPVFTLYTEDDTSKKDTNGNIPKKELTSEVLQKLKASRKPKTTVMLPMVVPAKRGRGRAMTRGHPVAMPANCTPRRLQRVIMQNTELKDSLALMEVVEVTDVENRDLSKERKMESLLKKNDILASKEKATTGIVEKSNDNINMHNIAPEVKKIDKEKDSINVPNNGPEVKKKLETTDENYFDHDHDYVRCTDSGNEIKGSTKDVGVNDFEDGEIMDEDSGYNERDAYDRSLKSREDESDNTHLFDKLPSYCTALSIPRKQVKKTASCVTGRGGITIQDYMQRDISPVRDTSTYNKVPEYFSSFTNSTRYDSINNDNMAKFSEDSKASSGYSSLTHSPDFSERPSRSGSDSRSRSRSVSHSKSVHETRSRRPSSYSSHSGYSSSGSTCSSSSCSDSSCCRSRSRSSNRSSSSSSSCSSCSCSSSRSLSRSPSRSPDRSWKRERSLRAERSRRNSSRRRHSSRRRISSIRRSHRSPRRVRRERSRSSRYSHRRRSRSHDYRSRSRSRSAHKIRSASKERFREERKKQREEEKQQQMKERRIVYVGGLPGGYSRHTLRDQFTRFGPIERVQLHFREHGDNYGFVTFTYTCDAYAAIEKGKKIPGLDKFDLCFGGRRQFCDVEYADLDGNKEIEEEFDSKPQTGGGGSFDFDELLRQAKAKIKKS